MQLKTIILLVVYLLGSSTLHAAGLDSRFSILPQPQKMEMKPGTVRLPAFVVLPEDFSYSLPENIDRLPRVTTKGIGISTFIKNDGTPESEEGYVLEIKKKGIAISARTNEGIFYGLQTLSQLMQDAQDNSLDLPCLIISDWPDLSFRAIHIDTKHHLDRTEYYYSLMDRLASYKINNVIWELEDKFGYTRRPEVAASNAISKQEMQAICRYAKERNIIIHPLVQGLGHASFILKHHWELRENPKSDWEFCPSNPETYDFLFDMYKDAMEAMPDSKYLHIGGDEITAIGIDERCKATGKTAFELQMEWLKKVCDFAEENGKTPIFWDDMPLKYSNLWWLLHRPMSDEEMLRNWNTEKLDEAVGLFPKNCIYMRWEYEDPTKLSHKKVLSWYKEHGLRVIAATSASTGGCPFMPRDNSRAQFIKDFCSLSLDNGFEGIMATAWDDGSPHMETVMRGFIALAEYSWNVDARSIDAFIASHAQREWALNREQVRFLDELEKSAYFFDSALIEKGSRNPAWGTSEDFVLINLPDKNNPGAWSEQYRERLDSARTEMTRYELIRTGLMEAKANARRNRYTLEVYESTGELINYPVKLLLSLEEYDKNPSALALKKVKQTCEEFYSMREKLEDVYSKTRFMEAPEGYLPDMNHHHHLAALTCNSDWLFLYEMPMTKSVLNWAD